MIVDPDVEPRVEKRVARFPTRTIAIFSIAGAVEVILWPIMIDASSATFLAGHATVSAMLALALARSRQNRHEVTTSTIGWLAVAGCGALGAAAAVAVLILQSRCPRPVLSANDWFDSLASEWTDDNASRLANDIASGRAYRAASDTAAGQPCLEDVHDSRRLFLRDLANLPHRGDRRSDRPPQERYATWQFAGAANRARVTLQALDSVDRLLLRLGSASPEAQTQILCDILAEVADAHFDPETRDMVLQEAAELLNHDGSVAHANVESIEIRARILVACGRHVEAAALLAQIVDDGDGRFRDLRLRSLMEAGNFDELARFWDRRDVVFNPVGTT